VLAYLRVSTSEQADSGAGLDAQRAAIEREAAAKGWQHVEWITDAGISAASVEDRPALLGALARLAAGDADVLCVSKLDRLSRSTHDFAGIVKAATREGWSLSILDLGLDMLTPQGSLMAGVLAVFAQFERELIGQRTRDGMAAKKAAGQRFGRPRVLPDEVRERITAMRADGATYTAIADRLNAEQVPTARGRGQWYPSTVHGICNAIS
jgi:DNA invertase Pin-like site-specific DNA recombinase